MRTLFRFCCLALLACSLLTPLNAVQAEELILAAGGVSDYVIILPASATPVQQSAARELQTVFKEMSGAELAIVPETEHAATANDKVFVIGPGKASAALLGSVDESAFPYDTICIKRAGNAIVLTGHATRGPIYAVDTFLEETLGCRWWTSTEAFIPKLATVTVDTFDKIYTPKLIYRESYYRMAHEGQFAVRSKCNGNDCRIPEELGGHHQYQFFVHSFYRLIPPQEYFLDHPDWFPEIDGVRKVGYPGWAGVPEGMTELYEKLDPSQIHEAGTQLCLTNEEMRKEFVKNLLENLANNPSATFVSVSQNDWHGYCTCPECSKIAEEEGSQSGVLLRFVNKVAEEVEKVRPDILVDTLAYQYTRKPPKITRPRHNVVVRLCSIECSFVEPLATDPKNASFKEDLEGWREMADRLFVWDYVTNFSLYLLPFPNYAVWQDNINFFVDNHVIGLFEQGDYGTESGDFTQLRNWVMSKLLWDPSLDQRELMKEFIAGYYAPELVPIFMDYFDTLSNSARNSGRHVGIFRTSAAAWLSPAALDNATRLLNEAERIAGDLAQQDSQRYANLVQKVQRERIPLDLVWLQEYDNYVLGNDADLANTPKDMKKLAESFIERIKLNGITVYREAPGPLDDFLTKLTKPHLNPKPTRPLPEPFASQPKATYICVPNERIRGDKEGEWTFREPDENASSGDTLRMPAAHHEWAVMYKIPDALAHLQSLSGDPAKAKTYKVYAFVRCDAESQEGPAMTIGVYDYDQKKTLSYRPLSVAETMGSEYKLIELPPFELGPEQQFWMAPAEKPTGLQNVYIDRVVIERQ
ncbi:MAG: DUF4838 domain-containing protein [Planctomycetia bacterium]|nr:DUF4838 domain-containing protein [Planctomycetia bacterium]